MFEGDKDTCLDHIEENSLESMVGLCLGSDPKDGDFDRKAILEVLVESRRLCNFFFK